MWCFESNVLSTVSSRARASKPEPRRLRSFRSTIDATHFVKTAKVMTGPTEHVQTFSTATVEGR